MKKKPINRIIQVKLHVLDTNKIYIYRFGIHTFLKEVENTMADNLGLDPIRTNIQLLDPIYGGRLDSTKTLFQAGYGKNSNEALIQAKLSDISVNSLAKTKSEENKVVKGILSTLDMTYKPALKIGTLVVGLNVESVCVNKKCINYNRDIIFPLGVGTFNLLEILNGLRCKSCPYRDMNVFTPTSTKCLKFKTCLFTLKGKIQQKHGISQHDIGCWISIQGEDTTFWQKLFSEHKWIEAYLVVKDLSPVTKDEFVE